MHSKYRRRAFELIAFLSAAILRRWREGGIVQMIAFENALLDVSERVISLMISNTILISCVRIINNDFYEYFAFFSLYWSFEDVLSPSENNSYLTHIVNRSKPSHFSLF